MNAPHRELIERIRGELQELEGVVQRALRAWPKAQKTFAEQEFYIDSVALNLQSFYAGVERLFELIARRMDQALPVGETWHRDLLAQMAQDVPDIRPAVISQDKGDDDFNKWAREVAQNIADKQTPPIYITITELKPVRSRIEKLKIELAA